MGTRGAALFFGAWSLVVVLIGAALVAQNTGPQGALPPEGVLESSRTAWYILGADCGLSTAVAGSLARHGPRLDLHEQVWLPEAVEVLSPSLRAAGFAVGRADSGLSTRIPGMHGGPWLALFAADGRLTFSGPYPKAWGGADASARLPRWLASLSARRR